MPWRGPKKDAVWEAILIYSVRTKNSQWICIYLARMESSLRDSPRRSLRGRTSQTWFVFTFGAAADSRSPPTGRLGRSSVRQVVLRRSGYWPRKSVRVHSLQTAEDCPLCGATISEIRTAKMMAKSVRFNCRCHHGRIICHPAIKNDSGAIL